MQRDNFNPSIWGPHAWFFLETIALSYPLKPSFSDKQLYKSFYTSIKDILPCHSCRINYANYLNLFPLNDEILSNKYTMFNWLLNIHNQSTNNKYNLNDSLLHYNKIYSKNTSNYVYILIFVIIVIIICCVLYKRYLL